MKRLGLAIVAALLPWVAAAQQVVLAPSPALTCLSPADAVAHGPDYPFMPLKRNLPGRVKVELEFTGPALQPTVRVLTQVGPDEAMDEFIAAIRAHVRRFRVPCMQAGDGPVRLIQEYVFSPDKRHVFWSAPIDAQDVERHRQLNCVQHESGNKTPTYPREAGERNLQGRVLARLRFTAPDQPPKAEVFARDSADPLRREIERWVAGVRMPCLVGPAVTGEWLYVFAFAGEAFGFKPIALRQLLGAVKGIQKQTLAIDTTTMNCPFDLRFTYRQPFLPNRVGEVAGAAEQTELAVAMAGPDPTRRPLLDWLRGIEIEVPDRMLDSIFGDTTVVSVPCIKINLKPKE